VAFFVCLFNITSKIRYNLIVDIYIPVSERTPQESHCYESVPAIMKLGSVTIWSGAAISRVADAPY